MTNRAVQAATNLLQDQRIRFLIVGAINTALGFGLFTLFQLTFGRRLGEFGYMVSLVLSYALAICVAFVLHRRYVFQVQGNLWLDFGRFVLANLLGLGLNSLILPLLVRTSGWDPIIAQAITSFFVAIISYLAHKHFSFRRR